MTTPDTCAPAPGTESGTWHWLERESKRTIHQWFCDDSYCHWYPAGPGPGFAANSRRANEYRYLAPVAPYTPPQPHDGGTEALRVLQQLLADSGDGFHPTIIDLCYTAFMRRASGKNPDDGGPCDWFNDTRPLIVAQLDKLSTALASAPAPDGGGVAVPREAFCNYVLSDCYVHLLERAIVSRLATTSNNEAKHIRAHDLLTAFLATRREPGA